MSNIDAVCHPSEAAIHHFKQPQSLEYVSQNSLSHYAVLQEFIEKVKLASGVYEDNTSPMPSTASSIGLISFLESLRDQTWADIKGVLNTYVPFVQITLSLTVFLVDWLHPPKS